MITPINSIETYKKQNILPEKLHYAIQKSARMQEFLHHD